MSHSKSEPPICCSVSSSSPVALSELKLYQAFIFSVPVFFTLILLILLYLFYLRRRRLHWVSLQMRPTFPHNNNHMFRHAEMGLKKELREMLPIIVYKESFSVRDTQCPVCLGDYQAEDRLQQIPACGHTFHMDCIDHWLANHMTCPLCRLSLLASAKVPGESPNNPGETGQESSMSLNSGETSVPLGQQACEDLEAEQFSEAKNKDSMIPQNNAEEYERILEFAKEAGRVLECNAATEP